MVGHIEGSCLVARRLVNNRKVVPLVQQVTDTDLCVARISLFTVGTLAGKLDADAVLVGNALRLPNLLVPAREAPVKGVHTIVVLVQFILNAVNRKGGPANPVGKTTDDTSECLVVQNKAIQSRAPQGDIQMPLMLLVRYDDTSDDTPIVGYGNAHLSVT